MAELLLCLPIALALALTGASASFADDSTPLILTVKLDDEAITPGTVRYLRRAIREAEQRQAECLVIVLDTPGGLVTSTRRLVKRILESQIPIVVYVAPQGSRAASAGVFITMAAHVAAMAPGTTIGAAHPVQSGGLPIGPQSPGPADEDDKDETKKDNRGASSVMEEKVVNDTVAWARALAKQRGRNEQWAADAVKKSVSITADEAVEKSVVDLTANDLTQLLEKINGREVESADGPRVLNTGDAHVEALSMWWGERLLTVISQPNVAFLLMIFGFYGILFELYSPGWGVAGTLGVICILLGFFGLSVLPVNYLGLALILVALALLTAEVFVTSYGALAVTGTVCLVLGGSMLVDSPTGFARVSLSVLVPVAVATAAITLVLVSGIVRAHRSPVQTGSEGLIGESGRAEDHFTQEDGGFRGMVKIHGERWQALSQQALKSGQACEVEDRDGLTLYVTSKEE